MRNLLPGWNYTTAHVGSVVPIHLEVFTTRHFRTELTRVRTKSDQLLIITSLVLAEMLSTFAVS
jgi:hypothetical protein